MLNDLWSYLTTTPSVGDVSDRAAALRALQTLIGTRLYPDVLKERADLPAASYQLISSSQDYALDATPVDIVYPRVQIDIYAATHNSREDVGGYIRTALSGYTGDMAGTNVAVLMFDNEINSYESDPLQYRKTIDFKVIHYTDESENAPSAVPGIMGASRHDPVETPDGVRMSFTFVGIPLREDLYLLVVDGLVDYDGYTQVGDVITLTSAPNQVYAYY